MGCSNCGTANGKPSGCKSNGGCSTGGCNRLNVHDWLANLPFSDPESGCRVVEVSFNQGSRKDFYRNTTTQFFEKGDIVSVEGVSGFDVGTITITGEIVRLQMKKKGMEENNPDIKKVLRRATDKDIDIMQQNKAREKEALVRSRAIARQLRLDMKMSEVEIQADGRKATFFYIADDRVDFRELIKLFASEFRLKVEMRQIGARQEAAKVGGIGSCGRELCCSTWLSDFKSVNTTAARYQNLSINQSKLSGQCGRLKCCLNYELDTYLDALQNFPDNTETLQVAKGTAILVKKDIFKNLMWYVLPDSNKQFPLTIERVRKIKQLNIQGTIPDGLEPVEVSTGKPKEEESGFVDLVGQISLKTLEKADRKKKYGGQGSSGGGGRQPGNSRPPGSNNRPPNNNRPPVPNNREGGEKREGREGGRPPREGREPGREGREPGRENREAGKEGRDPGREGRNNPEKRGGENRGGENNENRGTGGEGNNDQKRPPQGRNRRR